MSLVAESAIFVKMATFAVGFAATLLLAWRLTGAVTPSPVVHASAPSVRSRSRRAVEAVLGVVVVSTGIALTAYNLDSPLRMDESTTITAYATQPLAVAASKYDRFNNHVLHTLMVWVAHQVGGWDRVALRTPAFLAGCLLLPTLWWFVRREYGWKAAVFATSLVATAPYFIEYATNARGYTLMLLMFACALKCGQALIASPGRRTLWAVWSATIALGLYAVPVMAYPAASAAIWMILARWRRCGRDGLRRFALRTAIWSLAACAGAAVLYAPVLLGEGARPPVIGHGWPPPHDRVLRILGSPVVLWNRWHLGVPAWAQGVLLGLVVVGTLSRGRSCGRRGTLLLGMLAATGLVLLTKPAVLPDRVAIGALLVLMISAGAGAALVLDGAVAWAGARWPRVVTGPGRWAATCAGVALVLSAFAWWGSRPGVTLKHAEWGTEYPPLPALTSSVDKRMRAGDYFAGRGAPSVKHRTTLYVKARYDVTEDVGWLHEVPYPPSPVHRARGRADSTQPSVTSSAAGPRLFLFAYETMSWESLESRWPGRHEVVATFDHGRVYMVNDWTGTP